MLNLFDKKSIKEIKNKLFSDTFLVIILSFCAIVGMILGINGVGKKYVYLSSGIDFVLYDNISDRLDSSFMKIFTVSLATYFIFILIIFLLGLSVWGFLAVPAVIAYKGYGIGFLSGYLTIAYGARGFVFYAIVVLLGACLSTLAVVMAGAESIKMSFNILKLSSPRSNVNQRIFSSIRKFSMKLAFFMIVLCASALLDGLMNVLFAKFLYE